MSQFSFNPAAIRAKKARLANRLGKRSHLVLIWLTLGLTLVTAYWLAQGQPLASNLAGFIILMVMFLIWNKWDLSELKPLPYRSSQALDQILPADVVGKLPQSITAVELWRIIADHWQTRFILLRFDLHPELVAQALTKGKVETEMVWQTAIGLGKATGTERLNVGILAIALVLSSVELKRALTQLKLDRADLVEAASWLERLIDLIQQLAEPAAFGGIARDWAAGYTPLLDRYGVNLSTMIERGGYHFAWLAHSQGIDQMLAELGRGNKANAVLVGEPGVGKTSLVQALAQRLLTDESIGHLSYYQVVSLNAGLVLSDNPRPGQLERTVLEILGEAVHAGNIILFLDEAQLFFGHGTGTIDLSQVLLPVLGNSRIKMILAFDPKDWQTMVSTNPGLSSLLNQIRVVEPSREEVLKVLEDRSLLLENGSKVITYKALQETYRQAERYLSDLAFPGKAIKLLEDTVSSTNEPLITEASVTATVERIFGVKVAIPATSEAETLLGLETKIHQRMVNQNRAVKVVADALRRARAGVANPKRPIGSFLFLGPTGVGKTELARSLAASYFGSEGQMIRLDMSEYQTEADVGRLLATGESQSSLLFHLRRQPFSVVLLDEIEKAYGGILNLLLQVLDEGRLTDSGGKAISFKDSILIATSNAGADEIRQRVAAGQDLEQFEGEFVEKLIASHQFRPELLNRFDDIVLFRPLTISELTQVASRMIEEVNQNLAQQKIRVSLTKAAITYLAEKGYDPSLGARPMRRLVQRTVENAVAERVLKGGAKPGDQIVFDVGDLTSNTVSA